MKLKIQIKGDLIDDIHELAYNLCLYDDKFSEETQCGGYHAFKQLVTIRGELPPSPIQPKVPHDFVGFYLLGKIHFNLREDALKGAKILRKKYKIT